MNFVDFFEEAFSTEFEATIKEKFDRADDPMHILFVKKVPELLSQFINDQYSFVKGSIGSTNRASVYWSAFLDERLTSTPQRGVYIVYLLSHDGNRLFLSLNQGSDKVDGLRAEGLRRRANEIASKIKNRRSFTVGEIDLSDKTNDRANNYSVGSILSKEYCKGDTIPTDEELRKDLQDMIEIYKEYVDKQMKVEQKILFGAPGTGKSRKIETSKKDGGFGLDSISNAKKYRTTFHPDYDYAQFVGSYKPKMKSTKVEYGFVPQVFAKAYAEAWRDLNQPVYLIIEEINRGNCAQIFGDLFQLLDRKNGESEYSIDADADFAQWLVTEGKVPKHKYDENGCVKIKLPPNFNILATMNTSDQSLFPMDSAFKRRFDWEYVPIQYKNPYNAEKEKDAHDKWLADKFVIDLGLNDKNPKWLHFLKKINADIYKVTESEDKQMGEFFVKPRDGKTIDLDMFRSKVLFYLWDSVYKDEVGQKTVFRFENPSQKGSEITFQSLFGSDDKAIEIIKKMMENLDKAYESKDGSEFKDFKIL